MFNVTKKLRHIFSRQLIPLLLLLTLVLSACVGVPADTAATGDGPIELTWLDVCAPITTPITDMLIEKFESEKPWRNRYG